MASAIDISERVAAQRALRDSEDRYRRMFEGSIIGKALIDHRGLIFLANDSMAQMFGYEPPEMVGLAVHALVPPRWRAAHAGLVEGYLAEPQRRYMAGRQELFALRRTAANSRSRSR